MVAFTTLATGTGDLSIKAVAEAASDDLGNTPTIARNSYIHPAVVALAASDERSWRETPEAAAPKTKWLSRHERGLIAFVESDEAEAVDGGGMTFILPELARGGGPLAGTRVVEGWSVRRRVRTALRPKLARHNHPSVTRLRRRVATSPSEAWGGCDRSAPLTRLRTPPADHTLTHEQHHPPTPRRPTRDIRPARAAEHTPPPTQRHGLADGQLGAGRRRAHRRHGFVLRHSSPCARSPAGCRSVWGGGSASARSWVKPCGTRARLFLFITAGRLVVGYADPPDVALPDRPLRLHGRRRAAGGRVGARARARPGAPPGGQPTRATRRSHRPSTSSGCWSASWSTPSRRSSSWTIWAWT